MMYNLSVRYLFIFLFVLEPILNISHAQEYQLSWQVRFPQAIVYDEEENIYFVAYLTDNPLTQNGQSYISKVDKDLKEVISERFCVNLSGPQAISLSKAYLIVADQGSVKFFDRKTGFWQKTITFGEAPQSLISDVLFDGERFVYACDMFANALIRIDLHRNMESSIMDYGPWIDTPKRLLYNPRRKTLFVASYNSGSVYEFNPRTKEQKTIIRYGPTQLMGMAMDRDFNFYLSNAHNGGQIIKITPEKRYYVFTEALVNPANMHLHPNQEALLLPSQSRDLIFQIPFKQDPKETTQATVKWIEQVDKAKT